MIPPLDGSKPTKQFKTLLSRNMKYFIVAFAYLSASIFALPTSDNNFSMEEYRRSTSSHNSPSSSSGGGNCDSNCSTVLIICCVLIFLPCFLKFFYWRSQQGVTASPDTTPRNADIPFQGPERLQRNSHTKLRSLNHENREVVNSQFNHSIATVQMPMPQVVVNDHNNDDDDDNKPIGKVHAFGELPPPYP